MNPTRPVIQTKSKQMMSLFFGGILPILAFALIEEQYGPVWGTIVGMVFGIGEIIFEKVRYQKISSVTWISNLMILGLGGISIISQEGVWFKLQPALFEGFFASLLIGSVLVGKPFLLAMSEKQGTVIADAVKPLLKGMTFRLGLFFAIHSGLATRAAFYWTTAEWAWLKGAGVIASFLVYMLFELFWIRYQVRKSIKSPPGN